MTADAPSRRQVLGAGAAISAMSLGVPAAAQPPVGGRQPNLILFFPDTLRADALSSHGNPVCKTPNFDRLAHEGARFENCHVQFPVCGGSRCSLLTGWPTSVRGHRSLTYFLRPDEPNMFRYLRQAGYDVFWYGKNDALAQASFADSVTDWTDGGRPQTIQSMQAYADKALTPGITSMLFPQMTERRGTNDYANIQNAIRILERKEKDRPFCIFLPLSNPHPPYHAPAGFHDMYKPSDLPPLVPPGLPKHPAFHAEIRRTFHLDKFPDEGLRKVRAVYYGQVSYVDWMLGELMEALERTGHANDTAVIVGSDHGDYAGDYGLVEKWSGALEDCLTHVPLIAKIPGGKPGVVSSDMNELFDIMPTFLDLAGTKPKHLHFARSLMPQLHGKLGDPDRAAFTEAGYSLNEPEAFQPIFEGVYESKTRLMNEHPELGTRCAAVRTRTHKLIERPLGQSELYDCVADPGQARNLIDDPKQAKVRDQLRARLMTWYITTTGVPYLDEDPRGLPPRPRSAAPPAATSP